MFTCKMNPKGGVSCFQSLRWVIEKEGRENLQVEGGTDMHVEREEDHGTSRETARVSLEMKLGRTLGSKAQRNIIFTLWFGNHISEKHSQEGPE